MLALLRANPIVSALGGLGVILALLLAIQTVRLGHRSNQLESAKINLNECREGRKQDRAAYEQAQRDAAAKNEAEVKRIETEQDRISSNVETDLRARLERLRSELRKGTPASPSNPNGPKAGSDGGSPAEPDGQTGLCLTP